MIKRNGVGIINQRTANINIAVDTMRILQNESYTAPSGKNTNIVDQLSESIKNTQWINTDIGFSKPSNSVVPFFEVTNEKTHMAAKRLLDAGKEHIVALNFASAISPGGGFLQGSSAQEEDLCRCSGLYYCLQKQTGFYNKNIVLDNHYYTDDILYSKDVPFFRNENYELLENSFPLSIITCAAPNVNMIKDVDHTLLYNTIDARIEKILYSCYLKDHKTLVLGAWGCGAFGNDANMMADAFKRALIKMPAFEHVCFAVYDNTYSQPNFNAFRKVFEQ